ncbi:MAG: 6,7-dimethyl-8-ribityllumazine synthase [Chitinophagales bacterium]|nr:6,7-dimethyl-8-ribityllumazine synthase [Chitinophagales bacterium]MDW8392963.1 6,7-dimethyl-8-ribityllumazine synthase [Chitinophagales bacterium]
MKTSENDQAPAVYRFARSAKVVVLVASWHKDVTDALYAACEQTLQQSGIKKKNIHRFSVPGSFELPAAAALAMRQRKPDGIICLGCIIRGETRHHEYLAQSVAFGLQQLNVRGSCPVIFGVLTTDHLEQARARAGGAHGNKGAEAAQALISMLNLWHQLRKKP